MKNKLSSENVFAYIFLGDELCSPRIEISSDYDSVSNFIAQACTTQNAFVRITNILDIFILDAKLIDLGIFKEFMFNSNLELSTRNYISLNTLKYFEEPHLQREVDILNTEEWSLKFEINSNKDILESLNRKVYCNFKID